MLFIIIKFVYNSRFECAPKPSYKSKLGITGTRLSILAAIPVLILMPVKIHYGIKVSQSRGDVLGCQKYFANFKLFKDKRRPMNAYCRTNNMSKNLPVYEI